MNEYAPEVNRDEKCEVELSLHREKEDEEMIRERLGESIDWVEGMGSERSRNCSRVSARIKSIKSERTYPLMMRLVEDLVNHRDMEPAVDPVDAEVGKEQEPKAKCKLNNRSEKNALFARTRRSRRRNIPNHTPSGPYTILSIP